MTPSPHDCTGWISGRLPSQEMEYLACHLFAAHYPLSAWADPVFSTERNTYRRLAMHARATVIDLERWTLLDAADKLTAAFTALVVGKREITGEQQAQLKDYAESCLEDLPIIFAGDSSASWRHVPEDDDTGTIEDLKQKVSQS